MLHINLTNKIHCNLNQLFYRRLTDLENKANTQYPKIYDKIGKILSINLTDNLDDPLEEDINRRLSEKPSIT
jgi:hypothetical protein